MSGYKTSDVAIAAAINTSQTYAMRDTEGKQAYENRIIRLLDAAGPVIWDEALASRGEFVLTPADARLLTGDLTDFDQNSEKAMKAMLELDDRLRKWLLTAIEENDG